MCTSLTILLGIFRAVVIPIQFQDVQFTTPEDGLSACIQRAQDYLDYQFRDKLTFQLDITQTVTLSKDISHYGHNTSDRKDSNLREAIQEACNELRSNISFGDYDNDDNGTVDNVILIMAGENEAEGADEQYFWPQEGRLENIGGALTIGGYRISSFVTCTESSGAGTLCHEFLHAFGLKDMYDTDGEGSGGIARGLWGSTSVMDYGMTNDNGNTPPNFNAIEMEMLQLGQCDTLRPGSYTLEPIDIGRRYLRTYSRMRADDFFLFECRRDEGWDSGIGGSGLLIYHIDRSHADAGYSDYYKVNLNAFDRWQNNQVNCRPDRQCAELIAAVPDCATTEGAFYPQPSVTTFAAAPYAVTGIRKVGDNISFEVIEPIICTHEAVFQDAAILAWTVDNALGEGTCTVSWREADRNGEDALMVSGPIKSSDGLSFCHTLSGLNPKTDYRVTIRYSCVNGSVFTRRLEIRTKSFREGVMPFIYTASAQRGSGGTFIKGSVIPLRLFNAPDAVEIRWFYDGRPVKTDADGYFHLERSGTLKAELYHEDGSMDMIVKKITVE